MTQDCPSKDFIREIVEEDDRTGKHDGRVHTRFPPEPNAYLHIGHAKAIHISFGIARDYNGKFNLRFDDTNPEKEESEYVKSIIEDVKWLGADWEDRLFYASDYFEQMYGWAEELIEKGKAYVDESTGDQIKQMRGDVTTPGQDSPYRSRDPTESLELFRKMRSGDLEDGAMVLRAKIDMANPNMNMRDPIMYRIIHAHHHRQGDKWCIYPMYDWAHGLEDSIEGITHSLCSLEFENHRPLYDWFIDAINENREPQIFHPRQIEFARLNLNYTVMSKRLHREMVDAGMIAGYDDPRLPTLSGMRRRGYPPEAIADFCSRIGVAKVNSTIDISVLESSVRDLLNKKARRFMGVLRPLKVTIENYEEGKTDMLEGINNPEDPEAGTRQIPFGKHLYIERSDFMEEPPRKFFRMAPGREVRLRYAYLVTCKEVIKEGDEITELICTIDPESRGGNAPDGRRVKSTIHWVSAEHAKDATINLYDKLFTEEDPQGHDKNFKEFFNPASLEALKGCKIEPAITDIGIGEAFQFERTGYFCKDIDSNSDDLIINRTVPLRDSWAKMQKKGKK